MPMISEAVYSLLQASSTLTDEIGNRLRPNVIEESDQLPAVAYQRIAAPATITHDGGGNFTRSTFQFDIVAATALKAQQIETIIFTILNGYRGTSAGLKIHQANRLRAADTIGRVGQNFQATADYYLLHDTES